MRMNKSIIAVLTAAAVSAILPGCANYQLGTTLPPHLRTISVSTFKNLSEEPQIETTITSATLSEFQRDGQLKVRDADEADILLTGEILNYRLDNVRSDRNNPKTTREYKAIVTMRIHAVERATGKKVTEQNVTGSKTFEATGDLMTARRSVLPDLSRELGRKVVDAVISAW